MIKIQSKIQQKQCQFIRLTAPYIYNKFNCQSYNILNNHNTKTNIKTFTDEIFQVTAVAVQARQKQLLI